MMGFGGNVVVLMPNGISAFRFADGHHYDVDTMVLAGEAVRPFPCAAGSARTPSSTRQPHTVEELRTEVSGNTFYTDSATIFPAIFDSRYALFVAADGVLYGRSTSPDGSVSDDVGRWYITPDGQFCRAWHVWGGRRERCSAVSWEGETFAFSAQDRFVKEVYRRALGNPEGY
jgi:hypothetical protein